MLDPYVLLTFKGTQQRGALPAQERGSQKLPGVLDPSVFFFLKELSRGEPCQPRREAPRSCRGCWILTSSLLLKELSREGALPAQERSPQKLLRMLDPYVLLTFKGTQQRSPASPGERLPQAAGGAGSLRPLYF